MQELRTATDLALRATKVTARALGQTMSTLVVQERHLWLTLADMREADKHRFLDSPISQAGLFGEAVEDFAQQFSAAQKQTEAFRHILPRRSAAVSTPPPGCSPSVCSSPRAPSCLPPPPLQLGHNSSLHYGRSVELAAGDRRSPPPPLPSPWSARAGGVPETGDPEPLDPALQEMVTAPLLPPEEGRVENLLFPFCSVPPLTPGSVVPKTSIKEQFPFPPGPKRARMAVYETSSPHPRPPLSSPVGSRVRSEDATPSPASPAQLWSQVSVTPHTQTPLRDALPFESGPCAPFRCPTVGTSVTPLVPLARSLGAWLELPRPSRWLLRTIRLGYAIQFARRPPKFRGIRFTSVLSKDAPVLRAEVAVLLAKDAIEPVPPAEMKSGFYSPYFIVPKKGGGVTTNPGPARSESGPSQAPVQDVDAETHLSMRPSPRLVCSNRPEGRLLPCLDPPSTQTVSPLCVRGASIPVQGPSLRAIPVASCLHQGRRSRPCTVKGSRHSYPQLPRRLAHSGPVSSTVVRTQGYGAQSPQPVGTSGQPRKEQTLPCAEDLFSRHGVGLGQPHSTSLGGACSVNAEMPGVSSAQEGGFHWNIFRGSWGIWHPQPLSRRSDCFIWDRFSVGSTTESRDGMAPRHVPGLTHPVLPSHLQPMVGPCLSSGRSSPRASIQACCCFNRRLCHGLGGHVQRARSRGALDRAPAAVAYQLPRVAGSMACSAPLQNAATREAYTGPLGQHCDRCVHQPPRRSTLPSHVATRPPSPPLESEASEVASRRSCPGEFNRAADELSRQHALPGEWRLHPEVLTQICVSPSEPSRTDPVQGQGGRGASPLGCALLAQSDVVPRTDASRDSPSLANSSEEGSTFSERGHPLAPAPRLMESPRMVLGRDAEVLSGLPPAVVNTITSARALSTRQAYRLKWNLFVDWCSPRREDPRRCPIAAVLSFLQDGLERRLSPSTLKVYVAAIAAHHDAVDGKSLGKHDLVIRFLRGARRLNPPRPHLVPSWDLPSVLSALRGAPFEPLQSVELKFLSLKTVLLSALATVKRVGDLQAFSVDDSCLEFGPADSHVVLRPRPGYVPKVPTMPFRDQVVNLQALPREEADPAIALLCPVRALRIYVDRTQSFRTSDQLFVCFGGQQKGRAVSKQRLAHWIVEAIVLAYQARRLPCPLGVRAHSTRGVASSWALARGASIADICKAAGWATPNTFARFYNLRIEPVSSRVLVSDGQ